MEHGQQSPEQRRRIEEEEERREAERAAELSRQRALLQEVEVDTYVERRVRQEMEAIWETQRLSREEELDRSGGTIEVNYTRLILLGFLISGALLAMVYLLRPG